MSNPGGISTAPILWLEADVGVTSSGGSVSEWADQSGNGNNALPYGTSVNPTYVPSGLNSLPVIKFDGSTTWLAVSGTFACQTKFIVFSERVLQTLPGGVLAYRSSPNSNKVPASNENSDINFCGIFYEGSGGDAGNILDDAGAASAVWVDGIPGNVSNYSTYNTGIPFGSLTTFHILTEEIPGSVSGTKNIVIGADAYSGDGARVLDGNIAEIIVFSSILSDADREKVEAYLYNKWFTSAPRTQKSQ